MIIDIFLPLSLTFIMFTLGIGLTVQNFRNIVNQPKAFILGIINQMLLLPLITFLILLVIDCLSASVVNLISEAFSVSEKRFLINSFDVVFFDQFLFLRVED